MEDSLGTRFNDIFGCSEKNVGRAKNTRQCQTDSDDRSTYGTVELVILPGFLVFLGSEGVLGVSL